MIKQLLKQLTRIADALEESNQITRDIQQQTLAIAEQQQQALQKKELPISKYTGQTYDPRWAGQPLQGVEERKRM